jgi:hypothetical protein
MKKTTYLTLFLLCFSVFVFAQNKTAFEKAQKYLNAKGEVVFTFKANSQSQFEEINKIVSISHKKIDNQDLQVEAYATKAQFKKFLAFGLPYNVNVSDNEIAKESLSLTGRTAGTWDTTWDTYPKYSEYVAKMQYWATTYPNLCTLQSIGTTPNGRTLYVLKISDNAAAEETEPEFLYTSSMHGDEITGYPTMLRFIDYLLTNYGSNTEVANIVNGTELFICPLANPDGSYKTAGNDILNSTGNTATRANANGYDLNRNYPDPLNGLHPDSGLQVNPVYQPETSAFLAFERTRNFVLSANYHGGAEVVNFPWDTYPVTGGANIHPHDNYFKYVSTEYATLCQTADGNNLYMDDVYATGQCPGTTNGSAWYTVAGGRQDYNNYFNHSKEVTVEISATKFPAASTLPTFWNNNKQALLNYIKQASYGLQGVVTDAAGNPIHAKVYINGYDLKGSWVETSPTKGDYHKVLIAGTYNVIFEAPGYVSQTQSVTVTNGGATNLNIAMVPTTSLPTASDITICSGQPAGLTATGTGTIKWYASATATTPVATGTSYTTPALNSTTSYFVANVGPATATGTSSSNTAVANRYMIFNCSTPTKLKSVLVNASAVGQILVELQDSTGTMLESKVVLITAAGSQNVDLDFFLPAQNNLRLVSRQLTYTNLIVATSGITYPLTNGTVSITANSGSGTFMPFFNWKFAPVKSTRDEVVVTVKPSQTLASISPTTVTSGGSDFVLTVNGSDFVNGESIVRWNGSDRTTTFVSATELTAAITATDIAAGGSAIVTVFSSCGTTSGQIITIQSICAPIADVTSLPTVMGQCSATVAAPTATSSCTGNVIGTTATVFPITTQGTTVVTWIYNDGNGNTSTQNQTVIIDDTVAPVADVTTLPTATGQTSVTVTAPTATDACVGIVTGTTTSPLTYSTQGTFTIVWTYNDGNGNTSTQSQTVVVADTIAPTTPASLTVSGTTSNSTNLSWTPSTDNIAVTGYDVYKGATLQGTTSGTTYSVTGLTAATAYTFTVKAKDTAGNVSPSSNTVNVTTLSFVYCASKGNSTAKEKIGKVVLGTISNTSAGTTGYENFTALSANATKGTAYAITITPSWTSTKYKEGYAVWIDYNRDGDFVDAGELVWSKAASTTTPVSGSFTIPVSATLGSTRMRVSMKYNAIPTSCEVFADGQVEDYTINIISVAKIAETTKNAITDMMLYPNPTASILNVTSTSGDASYKIYNMLGQTVMNGKLVNYSVDVSNVSSGAYILEVSSEGQFVRKRFVKQ